MCATSAWKRQSSSATCSACATWRLSSKIAKEMRPDQLGQFDLTLFLGVLYHLENPMRALRTISASTNELCIVETQVWEDVVGAVEWGAQSWIRPYQGVLAVIDESDEFHADNREAGATPLVLCPSPVALRTMLTHAGFRRVEMLEPPRGAPMNNLHAGNEWSARRINRKGRNCRRRLLPSRRQTIGRQRTVRGAESIARPIAASRARTPMGFIRISNRRSVTGNHAPSCP